MGLPLPGGSGGERVLWEPFLVCKRELGAGARGPFLGLNITDPIINPKTSLRISRKWKSGNFAPGVGAGK